MRLLKLALCLMLALGIPACALADAAINGKDSAALIATDGTEIVLMGEYVCIKPLKEGFWCAIDAEGKRLLLNGAGEPVTETRFDELQCEKDTLLYREGKVWGILSDDGTPLVAAKYSDIRVNGEGDFIALRNAVGTGTAQNVDFLDANGNETAIGVRVLYGLNDFSQGFMPVLFAKSGRYGYIDPQGVVAFEGQYIAAGEFKTGYAVVTTDDGVGMINRMGRMVVPDEYAGILRVGDIALLQEKTGGVMVLRIGGEELLRVSGEAYVGEAGQYGLIFTAEELMLIDGNGHVAAIFPASATIEGGGNGQIIVRDGLWGEACAYVAQSDGTQVGGKYQMILPLENSGYYAVGQFDATPVAGDDGDVIRYEWEAEDIRFALMNGQGELMTGFDYSMIRMAEPDRFYAVTEDVSGVMDAAGRWIWIENEM